MVGVLKGAGGLMRTGENGRTVITWTQTELDGLEAAPLVCLCVGASWSWRGRSLTLAGDRAGQLDLLGNLAPATGLPNRIETALCESEDHERDSIELTNGARRFVADLLWLDGDEMPVLVFEHDSPERDEEYWVSHVSEHPGAMARPLATDTSVVPFPVQQDALSHEASDLPLLILTAAE